MTNAEVRKLVADVSVIGRDLLARGAGKLAETVRPEQANGEVKSGDEAMLEAQMKKEEVKVSARSLVIILRLLGLCLAQRPG